MNVDARAEAWAVLHLSGVAPRALFELLRALSSPEAVLDASPAQLSAIAGAAAGKAIKTPPDAARHAATLAWLAGANHYLVAWDDPAYPCALLEIADPPPVLYCHGRLEALAEPAVAIVGSRNATPQGCADAEAFAAALTAAGLSIVSGLALGIDAAAHRGALKQHGGTIAVVATGPDRVYPARHRELAHAIADSGAIVSEFAPGTPPLPGHFPRRNRLISGLARGVLVVEATMSSGSLITARLAGEQGREVFALPGSIHSPFSKGCHKLIREGAKLVETAQDILDELAFPATAPSRAAPFPVPAAASRDDSVDPNAVAVLAALARDLLDVDRIVILTGLEAAAVTATLVGLELDGRVIAVPGGLWQRQC